MCDSDTAIRGELLEFGAGGGADSGSPSVGDGRADHGGRRDLSRPPHILGGGTMTTHLHHLKMPQIDDMNHAIMHRGDLL